MARQPDSVRPPRVARTLAACATPRLDRAFVLADLDEEYVRLRTAAGRWTARRWYWRQVLGAVRAGLARRVAPRPMDGARRRWPTSLGSDLRFAARRIRQAPLVLLVTVASLGLGIGATTTVFSVANGLLLRSSPAIADPDGVLSVYTVTQADPIFGETSFPDFRTLEDELASVEAVAALRVGVVRFGDGEDSRPVMVEIVTGHFFDVLGVRPALGRFFSEDETTPGAAERIAVVSHDFWQGSLGGSQDVLGRQIRLDNQTFTVVGVAPEDFGSRLAEMKMAAWVPAGLPGGFYHATDGEVRDRAARQYEVLARIAPAFSPSDVEAELALVASRLHAEYGDVWEDSAGKPLGFRVVAGNPGLLPPEFTMALGATAAVVLAFAGLILLIACSNVAGLLLAQAHERRREIAVRAALGASRRRLVRLLLTESALLALLGGGVGVLAARAAVTAIGSVGMPVVGVPIEFDFGVDARVLLFALGMSAAACLFVGLLPALSGSRTDLVPALKTGTPNAGGSPLRLRRLLVVAQVTASLVLLVGAGLVLRSTESALDADLGFVPDRIAVMSKDLSFDAYAPADAMLEFQSIAETIAAHPDVEAVALSTSLERVIDDLTIARVRTESGGPAVDVRLNAVDSGYMTLLGLQIVEGRAINGGDRQGTERVVVVNEAFAAAHWPGQSAVGRAVWLEAMERQSTRPQQLDERLTVVGVVRDPAPAGTASDDEFGVSALAAVNARIWVPLAQHPSSRIVFHARARNEAASVVPVLRSAIGIDDVAMVDAQPLEDLIALPLVVARTAGRVMRWGGAFALVLAFLGIYGIVSFAVTARSREMAIRKAIGARSDQVVGRVMRQGLMLAGAGIAIGLVMAVPLAFLLQRGELATVSPLDPVALGTGVTVILAAAFLASVIPARRLVRLDPMAVLRDE